MADHPDLTAELDAAEAVVMGGATVVTEWGVRYDEDYVHPARDEQIARKVAALGADLGHVAARRTVTYGPWEAVPRA